MADKMLIDATHPEETRVVVLRGNRVEEFDFESANRKQLRGNIYLAKVTRVEPSLQAAFVDYGGNRHGFLAFSEIHPDYYQIPVADRQALLAEEARAQREADDDADNRGRRGGRRHRGRSADRRHAAKRSRPVAEETAETSATEAALDGLSPGDIAAVTTYQPEATPDAPGHIAEEPASEDFESAADQPAVEVAAADAPFTDDSRPAHEEQAHDEADPNGAPPVEAEASFPSDDELAAAEAAEETDGNGNGEEHAAEDEGVESVGGADALEEAQERAPRFRRQYKIQEVIKRRQVMLVQVVKEERGTKGAALTTYLSLAGRYSVLMPNTARGGGISRKITNSDDRSRLKEIAQELDVPEGMGVILRTAGASRTKTEVKRDFEYLLRLWETVRDLTLKSTAPTLVYEEGSLVKRSIRDLYSKDIDDITVSGEDGYKEARDFMRMLMPSHVKNVKLYKETQPLFTRCGIESQLDAMFSPVVQLRSGGYIVINQAEALVAIDVNSGRATREHHIEDTALKTNLEAAEEIARQLRLRDLAGLIVIDFIDMDEGRNNRTVERRLKEALKHDRARIQVGRISHFGLLEMSRQRIRTSVLESSTEKCPVCGGSGHIRSVSSVALQCLRAVEEMLIKGATHNLIVRTRAEVALYVLNHKRAHLRDLEERFRVTLTVASDPAVTGQQSYIIDRGEQMHSAEAARQLAQAAQSAMPLEEAVTEADAEVETIDAADAEAGEREGGRRRRRRRGRGRSDESRENGRSPTHETAAEHAVAHEDHDDDSPEENGFEHEQPEDVAVSGAEANGESRDGRRRRRRGRRGGRRNRRGHEDEARHDQNGERVPDDAHAADTDQVEPIAGKENGHDHVPAGPAYAASEPELSVTRPTAEAAFPPPAEAASRPTESEPPRRRSTIREPAPFAAEGQSESPPSPTLPPPQSAISISTGDEPAQPKRGWWGRRLLGDKS